VKEAYGTEPCVTGEPIPCDGVVSVYAIVLCGRASTSTYLNSLFVVGSLGACLVREESAHTQGSITTVKTTGWVRVYSVYAFFFSLGLKF
jgi:hypothetical protein